MVSNLVKSLSWTKNGADGGDLGFGGGGKWENNEVSVFSTSGRNVDSWKYSS